MNKNSSQARGAVLYMPSAITWRNEVGGRPGVPTAIGRGVPNRSERPITAANFGGASSGAVLTIPSGYVGLNQGTVSLWVQPTFAYGSTVAAYCFDSDTARHAFYHSVDAGKGIEMYNDGRVTTYGSSTWTANAPTHLCFVYNKTGNVQQLYINGIAQTSSAASGTWGASALGTNAYIGSRFNTTENWQGLLWEPLIYQRPLTAPEVLNLYLNKFDLYDRLPPWWSDAYVAPAGGFQSAWASGRNVVIGVQ